MKPYKIVAYEPGAAHIVDRKSDRSIGYVLQNFHGRWTPMRDRHALRPPLKYRAAAAQEVWDTAGLPNEFGDA